MLALASLPAVLSAQLAGVSIGKPASRLTVAVHRDSAVVMLTGPDAVGGGVATARLTTQLPDARGWASTTLKTIASCRADKARAPRQTTLYDRAARDERGEGRLPRVLFSCGGGRRGELASVDLTFSSDFAAGLRFTSYGQVENYFLKVATALGTDQAIP
jgi:hypothetical protein